jgi:hypothetical protein
MKKGPTLILLTTLFLCCRSNSFGNVGATVGPEACGSGGTLYRNLTSRPLAFELLVSASTVAPACSVSVSWTDASGHPQTLPVNPNFSAVATTTLPADGTIAWTSTPDAGQILFLGWEMQRGQGASVGPMQTQCGSSGSPYHNLTDASIEFDMGFGNANYCATTFSWTDELGRAQTLTLGPGQTQGVSTSVAAGGTISWTSTGGRQSVGANWQIEQIEVRP